nr:hypothetical protein [uncultured Draconibacterium sp.]
MLYKVKIIDIDSNIVIETHMPIIPMRGDTIGYYRGGDWILSEVGSLVYEFDKKGQYEQVEISLNEIQ